MKFFKRLFKVTKPKRKAKKKRSTFKVPYIQLSDYQIDTIDRYVNAYSKPIYVTKDKINNKLMAISISNANINSGKDT